MTELKTLKEIGCIHAKDCNCHNLKPVLKQEALKWFREFQSIRWENVEGHADIGGEISGFIKHFFDINEGELSSPKARDVSHGN